MLLPMWRWFARFLNVVEMVTFFWDSSDLLLLDLHVLYTVWYWYNVQVHTLCATFSLFPSARARPILTSQWAGCKINVIHRKFTACIAIPQILEKQWSVMLQRCM